ncbi:MAG: transcriptional repressor [Gammaproteobacteria bacterium]|nr:MAG: transcriptional repressor [Gammaproteobacteria bacterium]
MKRKFTSSRQEVTELLRAHGISPTRQRVDLGCLLFARPDHYTADDLYNRARDAGIRVSKATIYNTLGTFSEHGLLREVVVDSSAKFYDSNLEPHQHLFDVDTGRLTDLDSSALHIEGLPELPANARIEGVDVIIRYRSRPAAAH